MAAKMQLGAEPWKVAFLVGLLGVAGYLFYTNVFSAGGGPVARPPSAAPAAQTSSRGVDTSDGAAQTSPRATNRAPGVTTAASGRAARSEFRPSLRMREDDRVELTKVDPTLRVDLLAKLGEVRVTGANRNLFEFGAAAPQADPSKPKQPEPKIVPKAKFIGPLPAPPPPPPPVKPPPPPISLKFYGSALPVGGGVKRVFCIDGDQIFTPSEGEVLKRRYRIVRINTTSVVVEDLEYKHQQTLPIDEAPRSG